MCKLIKYFIAIFLAFSIQGAWAKVHSYIGTVCQNNPALTCITVKKGDTWDSLWPDGDMQDKAMRINRMNTYLSPGMQLIVPDHMSDAQIAALLPFQENIGPQDHRTVIVNVPNLAWAAYDTDGKMVRWGPASTGRDFCPDIGEACKTPAGVYTFYRKGGESCASSKYPVPNGGAPIPFCMFFKGGFAIHGSNFVPGYNDSHGCVRVYTEDAQWLNQEFISIGSTKVIVERS